MVAKSEEQVLIRLEEEEDALRDASVAEGAQGKNGSDYRQMYNLFLRLFNDAATIRADPNAFMTDKGQYNDKVINAYAKLMGLAMKGMSELNRMRNNDKMVARMLNENTKDLAQSVVIELGNELKSVIEAIDTGADSDEVVVRLKRLMYRRVPEIFLKSAGETLTATRESYGLLN
jgi:hypothetical protein